MNFEMQRDGELSAGASGGLPGGREVVIESEGQIEYGEEHCGQCEITCVCTGVHRKCQRGGCPGLCCWENCRSQEQGPWADRCGLKSWHHHDLLLCDFDKSLHFSQIWSCCCSVAQPCPTLWDPMDCSTPGFPARHLPELAQAHVH